MPTRSRPPCWAACAAPLHRELAAVAATPRAAALSMNSRRLRVPPANWRFKCLVLFMMFPRGFDTDQFATDDAEVYAPAARNACPMKPSLFEGERTLTIGLTVPCSASTMAIRDAGFPVAPAVAGAVSHVRAGWRLCRLPATRSMRGRPAPARAPHASPPRRSLDGSGELFAERALAQAGGRHGCGAGRRASRGPSPAPTRAGAGCTRVGGATGSRRVARAPPRGH